MQEKLRIQFIVNPISGTSGKRNALKMVDSYLDKERFEYEVLNTQYAGHAEVLAREAACNGIDVVCAVGGDGTVNEIARALVHTNTALAIIPAGSGNGLARHLHIPLDPIAAVKVINEYNRISMDYGTINDRTFFCTCGVGFDAFISQKFAEAGKRGPLTYLENVLKNGLSYNPETYVIEADGVEFDSVFEGNENAETVGGDEKATDKVRIHKAFLISCANASQYGNNAYIAPQASVCDGLMDVTIMEPFGIQDVPSISIQMITGKLDQNSRVKTFRCKRLHISRQKPGAVHFDGDPIEMGTELDVQLVPKSLYCLFGHSEGVQSAPESIQNLLSEQLGVVYTKTEQIIQNNLERQRRIVKKNMDFIRKLSGN